MNLTFEVVLAFAAGYAVGSVPLGLVVAYLVAGIDIRRYGTGNVGASNVWRNVGLLPAAVVALGVFLQGLLPPLVARLLGAPDAVVVAAAMGAVVGYGWSIFLGFKGGRGAGVSTGAAAVFSPEGFAVLLAVYGLGWVLRHIALAVLFGFLVYAALVFLFVDSAAIRLGAVLLLILIVVRRLEGVGKDLEHHDLLPTVAGRLLFDRRPDQRLSGPNGQEG